MQNQQIILIHGKNYKQMTKQLLQAAGLADEIGSRDTPVALKSNLVIGAPASRGATTHPELVAGVLEYLQENGFRDLRVIEGSWVGSRTSEAVQTSGLLDVCRQYRVPFIDLQKDASASYDAKGMQIKVCNEAMRPGFLINMPVLKGPRADAHHLRAEKREGADPQLGKAPLPRTRAARADRASERADPLGFHPGRQHLRRSGL